ncbi:hypothetical protein ACK323_00120 [Aeromonas enteropelogenes]|uniref:hypothetical protein n=1 Tax=Aeromonas enteropelogenes TaxID=29489 RepID=UPI003988C630
MEVFNEILDDYSEYCHQRLQAEFGLYSPETYDPIYLYQRYKCRIIEKRARLVFESKELSIPKEHKIAYEGIIESIKVGECLKKYQSRKLKNLHYDDDMLSHWGIQHFHLSLGVERDGFVTRTGELLFIHFSAHEAHILGVFDHSSWCDLSLIQIMHDNWPNQLAIFKINSNVTPLTISDYKTLRKKHYNVNVTVSDGTEYLCPGMGVTANGAPLHAVFNSNKVIFMFNQYFEFIKANIEHILESDPSKRNSETVTIGMEFLHDKNIIAYKVKETGFIFTLCEQ